MTDNMPPRIYLNTQGELFNASRDGFTRYATEYTRSDLVKPLLDALEYYASWDSGGVDTAIETLQQYNEVMR